MEHRSPMIGKTASTALGAAPRAELRLITTRFQLAQPPEPAPEEWRAGLAQLLDWLGIDADFVPSAAAPLFTPWLGWAPSAFQHGGLPGLPDAHYVASYLVDHGRGGGPGWRGADMMLMSPHSAHCIADKAGGAPLPRAKVMEAMIRAAKAEGREKLAIIVHARQRNAIARQLNTAHRALKREDLALDILTIEDALPALIAGVMQWDAIIAMPDLRSTVFTLLAHTSGAVRAWPMLWHDGQGLLRVTCEVPGEERTRLALDAPALIHALALTLHHSGNTRASLRLHKAWSRLRDSGVTTAGRGDDAPYVTTVKDAEFLTMLCGGTAVSKRPLHSWRALAAATADAKTANAGSQLAALRIVVSDTSRP